MFIPEVATKMAPTLQLGDFRAQTSEFFPIGELHWPKFRVNGREWGRPARLQ